MSNRIKILIYQVEELHQNGQ